MVSYAPEGGSVGPHVDNYDVFLLQVGPAPLLEFMLFSSYLVLLFLTLHIKLPGRP